MENPKDIAVQAKKFNLEDGLVKNLKGSEVSSKNFLKVIEASGLSEGQKKIGNMLYSVATKLPVIIEKHRDLLAKQIGSKGISNPNQLDYAIDYLVKAEKKGGVQMQKFNKDCGIGVVLTEQDIKRIVNENIDDASQTSSIFEYMTKIKTKIPYVEGKVLKQILQNAWKEKGLPQKPVKAEKKTQKKKNDKKNAQTKNEQAQQKPFHIKDISELIGREMNSAVNSKQNLQARQKQFGSGILTRFPPQPNGYLHIGHCKAMRFNFMQAKVSNGNCYLRFDDTNPIKENQQFIDNIIENITWMGYKPWKITHASDNFDKLYEFAVRLIKQGDAFVCSETKQQLKKKRAQSQPSKDRNRSIEQNLRLFEQMRLGLYAESQLCLRAKIDYKHPNTTLRDPAIYRIRYTSHPHAGDKWCVYPLYDFTHPCCDSIEGISHSLCSLQFEIRRQLYYWFLEKLDMYRPNVWQYSRLNITNTVMSKRTLHSLIFDNKVDGWDDPRVLTINGMRRRGYPAQAINSFCDSIGVTRRGNQNYIQFGVLQNQVRKYLDIHAPRTMAVLDPVDLYIDDVQQQQIQVPLFPKNEEKGKRKIRLTKHIYVDRQDVKLKDEKGFYGIAPNKIVGLKYFSSILIRQVKQQNGIIVSIHAQVDKEKRKPNSHLNWIAADQSFSCEIRVYGHLFTVQKPADYPNFMDYLNKDSKKVHKNAKCHKDLIGKLKVMDRLQFERKGFYIVDQDSDIQGQKIVWNNIVSLQQDKGKK